MADYDPINGPEMVPSIFQGRIFEYAIFSDTFRSYNIHVLNPNGMPNKPNAMWNQFKITEWIDPSTLDSRGLIHEVYNMSGQCAYIEGDATGNTFSWSTKCNIPGAPHYTASNAGHFTMSAHDGMGGVRSNVDLIYAGSKDDVVRAFTGNDTVFGQDGDDWIEGGSGNDSLDGGSGNDTIWGGTGNDYITGDSGNDLLFGDDGNDTIEGGDGNDILDGGLGADVLIGGSGVNYVSYLNSNVGVSVTLTDTAQNGYYVGFGKGGEAEGDALLGIQGIQGSAHDDILIGNSENNFLYGEGENDSIDGGAGDDVIYGGSGHDSLIGGTGDDTLYGESGNDVYLWNVGDGMDFFVESSQDSGEDTLVIRGTTDLYVLKDGNNLALGTGGSDWAIIYNYFQDAGMEYAVIGNARYTTASLAAMATSVAQNSVAEANTAYMGTSSESALINFADIEAVNLMGIAGEQIDFTMV